MARLMLRKSLFYYLFTCLLLDRAISEEYDKQYEAEDIFQVFKISAYALGIRYKIHPVGRDGLLRYEKNSVIERLNEFLETQTDSDDLDVNLDIILEQFLVDQRSLVQYHGPSSQAKRLLLALRTLDGENECNYYGYKVLSKNLEAIQRDISAIINNENLRRVDKIVAHCIKRHIRHCGDVYFTKFDEISEQLDQVRVNHLSAIYESTIKSATSDDHLINREKSLAERLYNAAAFKIKNAYDFDPENVLKVLKNLAANNPDARYLQPVMNEYSGVPRIRRDKFEKIFSEYFIEPCRYFRQQFGPDVFEPTSFDNKFYHMLRKDRADFYEAWYKYRLCSGLFDRRLRIMIEYADKLKV